MDFGRGYAWACRWTKPALGIMTPYDGKPATVGNGVMVAIVVDSKDKVDASTGRRSNSAARTKVPPAPGQGLLRRLFRDLDGNKLNVFCLG